MTFRKRDKDKKGERSIEETTLRAGRRITRNNTNTSSTLSFRATRNPPAGQAGPAAPGFVVSGHAAQNAGGVGNPFRLNGTDTTIIGRVDGVRVSGGTDAAFCDRADGITLSNLIQQNSQMILPLIGLAPEGVTVFLAGSTNLTAVRSGVVTNANATSSGTGLVTLIGARASYSSAGGDSGGLIYRVVDTGRRIVGVHARSNGFYTLITPPL